jgi:hypothetical protein
MTSTASADESDAARSLTYEDTKKVLAKLADLEHPIVLIGGQAVNFWASYYEDRRPSLKDTVHASKDIDFAGSQKAVEECARRLGGTPRLATFDDHCPNTGIVLFVDDDNFKHQIDFLGAPAGVEWDDLRQSAIEAQILDENGAVAATFSVMHPVRCLRSRATNVVKLPNYQSEHALNQLRAAIVCAREFLMDLLDDGDVKAVNKLNENIFDIPRWWGRPLYDRYGIDVFDAVVVDDRLPLPFRTKRYPQMQAELERVRAPKKARSDS